MPFTLKKKVLVKSLILQRSNKIVAGLTNGNEQLTNMISTMEQDKIKYATQTICRDLLDLIGHSSQPQEIYGKVPLY